MKPINVFSLFDGMSCGQLALQKAGVPVGTYHASEIDKWAMKVTTKNFPFTLHMGDITKLEDWRLKVIRDEVGIDLVMGGSPCQGFSFAGKNLNFEDPRSKLFFDFVRVLKILKPKYFLLENVRMKKESQDVISEYLGVEPVAVNSNLVSAQNRHRLYWTNIPFSIPHDKGIVLADILEDGVTDREKSHCLDANYFKGGNLKSYFEKHRRQLVFNNKGGAIRGRYDKDGKIKQQLELRSDDKTNSLTTVQKDNVVVRVPELKSAFGACIQVGEADLKGHDIIKRVYSPKGKAPTLTTMGGGHREPKVIVDELTWRKLTPLECERLQTVPDGYTEGVSNTQRYKMLGNGWTVDVVAHILKGIRHKEEGLETINKWTKYGLAL
jgi:DNA-cytosine methyltransferase